MVLLVVSMLSILTIAFFSTMQIEEQAAHAFANTQRAKMVAQGAVGHGIGILRNSIPEPALINESAADAPGENWAVNPGRLTVFDDDGKVEYIDLHTGAADEDPSSTLYPDVYSVDLNEPLPGKTYPAIVMKEGVEGDAAIPPMRVKWVNLLKEPGAPASKDNPISARYGFWIDDESARINFNVALGKPDRNTIDPQQFWEQYKLGMMPPLFTSGAGDVEFNSSSKDREWALGQPRSVNLDVLFEDRKALLSEELLGHAWLRGFSRYPESILDFVDMPHAEREAWYHKAKYHLTFYSRSPEFNAFGRSRLFTTNIPLSLEAGPLYQLPFVYNGPGTEEPDYEIEGVMHLHSLMGSLGFTHRIDDDDKGNVHAANIVNRAQFEMLKRYMGRRWPGYSQTFLEKYGEAECYQIALNMLTMARMATTTMNTRGSRTSSRDLAWRSTSVIYSPHSSERPSANPERHYWQVETEPPEDGEDSGKVIPMLPQTPGPHITEVRLMFRAENNGTNPVQKRIKFRYQVEYYQHGLGQIVWLNEFPTKVDFLRMEIEKGKGDNMPAFYELGPPDSEAGKSRADRNWNHNRMKNKVDPATGMVMKNNKGDPIRIPDRRSLGSLRLTPGRNLRMASAEATNKKFKNRVVVSSPWRYLGRRTRWLANPEDNQQDDFDFFGTVNSTKEEEMIINVRWRLGMGVRPAGSRPRQMIPLGENEEDTLEAKFTLDLRSGKQEIVTWQIADPRLSDHKEQWIFSEGPGTPGALNAIDGTPIEPEELASEKSKFRYFQRGPGSVRDPEKTSGRAFGLNRPDEYNSRSRITSKGFWSVLHTGMQNQVPWRTLNLGGVDDPEDPPDYLFLDLLGATYPMQHDQWKINSTLPDEFSTASFMNSTAGQVNLNSRIYPEGNDYFQAPPRSKPLEAVFAHLRQESEVNTLLDGIKAYQESDFFRYVGELAEIEGYRRVDGAATQFENEEYLRNMVGCLTTKSNTFGLWGAAQVVQKARGMEQWGEFEDGDRVLGEKRFFALIERYIWPGKDGRPGNAHANSQGRWDRIAKQNQPIDEWTGNTVDRLFQLPGSPPMRKGGGQRLSLDLNGTYPWYDGPQQVGMDRYTSKALGKVKWTESTLEDAYNPPQPVIKYRVVYFKYLDE